MDVDRFESQGGAAEASGGEGSRSATARSPDKQRRMGESLVVSFVKMSGYPNWVILMFYFILLLIE
jgi:hypothetical protein